MMDDLNENTSEWSILKGSDSHWLSEIMYQHLRHKGLQVENNVPATRALVSYSHSYSNQGKAIYAVYWSLI